MIDHKILDIVVFTRYVNKLMILICLVSIFFLYIFMWYWAHMVILKMEAILSKDKYFFLAHFPLFAKYICLKNKSEFLFFHRQWNLFFFSLSLIVIPTTFAGWNLDKLFFYPNSYWSVSEIDGPEKLLRLTQIYIYHEPLNEKKKCIYQKKERIAHV